MKSKKRISLLLASMLLIAAFTLSANAASFSSSAWNCTLIWQHNTYGSPVNDVQSVVRVEGTSSSASVYMYVLNTVQFYANPNVTRSASNTFVPGSSSGNAAYANAALKTNDWPSGASYYSSYSKAEFTNLASGAKYGPVYVDNYSTWW